MRNGGVGKRVGWRCGGTVHGDVLEGWAVKTRGKDSLAKVRGEGCERRGSSTTLGQAPGSGSGPQHSIRGIDAIWVLQCFII